MNKITLLILFLTISVQAFSWNQYKYQKSLQDPSFHQQKYLMFQKQHINRYHHHNHKGDQMYIKNKKLSTQPIPDKNYNFDKYFMPPPILSELTFKKDKVHSKMLQQIAQEAKDMYFVLMETRNDLRNNTLIDAGGIDHREHSSTLSKWRMKNGQGMMGEFCKGEKVFLKGFIYQSKWCNNNKPNSQRGTLDWKRIQKMTTVDKNQTPSSCFKTQYKSNNKKEKKIACDCFSCIKNKGFYQIDGQCRNGKRKSIQTCPIQGADCIADKNGCQNLFRNIGVSVLFQYPLPKKCFTVRFGTNTKSEKTLCHCISCIRKNGFYSNGKCLFDEKQQLKVCKDNDCQNNYDGCLGKLDKRDIQQFFYPKKNQPVTSCTLIRRYAEKYEPGQYCGCDEVSYNGYIYSARRCTTQTPENDYDWEKIKKGGPEVNPFKPQPKPKPSPSPSSSSLSQLKPEAPIKTFYANNHCKKVIFLKEFKLNKGPNENGEYCKCQSVSYKGYMYESKWCNSQIPNEQDWIKLSKIMNTKNKLIQYQKGQLYSLGSYVIYQNKIFNALKPLSKNLDKDFEQVSSIQVGTMKMPFNFNPNFTYDANSFVIFKNQIYKSQRKTSANPEIEGSSIYGMKDWIKKGSDTSLPVPIPEKIPEQKPEVVVDSQSKPTLYQPGVTYTQGSLVLFHNKQYKALRKTNKHVNTLDFEEILSETNMDQIKPVQNFKMQGGPKYGQYCKGDLVKLNKKLFESKWCNFNNPEGSMDWKEKGFLVNSKNQAARYVESNDKKTIYYNKGSLVSYKDKIYKVLKLTKENPEISIDYQIFEQTDSSQEWKYEGGKHAKGEYCKDDIVFFNKEIYKSKWCNHDSPDTHSGKSQSWNHIMNSISLNK